MCVLDEICPLPLPNGMGDLGRLIELQRRKIIEVMGLPAEMLGPAPELLTYRQTLALAKQQERVLRQIGIRLGLLLPESARPVTGDERLD